MAEAFGQSLVISRWSLEHSGDPRSPALPVGLARVRNRVQEPHKRTLRYTKRRGASVVEVPSKLHSRLSGQKLVDAPLAGLAVDRQNHAERVRLGEVIPSVPEQEPIEHRANSVLWGKSTH